MVDKSNWLNPGENEILKFFRGTPKGIDGLPDFEQVAKVMGYLARRPFGPVDVEVATDALAELQPEQREFWLRVGATHADNFVRTMTAIMEMPVEEDSPSNTN